MSFNLNLVEKACRWENVPAAVAAASDATNIMTKQSSRRMHRLEAIFDLLLSHLRTQLISSAVGLSS